MPSSDSESPTSTWWVGSARSGKTDRLIRTYTDWIQQGADGRELFAFAPNSELRSQLSRRLQAATHNAAVVQVYTPIGFFQREVMLYWPLLQSQLGLLARFPLAIAPENEQELADGLFASHFEQGELTIEGFSRAQIVRHIVDNLQLAASANIPAEEIGPRLQRGRSEGSPLPPELLQIVGELAVQFRTDLLKQGLLTYSSATELYGQQLLPHRLYRQQLLQRCRYAIADDIDEYPALMADLFEYWLQEQIPCAFGFNPTGAVRLGYGADPGALERLAEYCTIESLPASTGLTAELEAMQAVLADPSAAWEAVSDPLEQVELVQRSTRRELLRAVAEAAIAVVESGRVLPEDMAIVGPGLDPVAVYALTTLLAQAEIPVRLLDNSRPLWSSPTVRALLTFAALVYPNCGHLLSPEAIAELFTVATAGRIDPVRAGLLSDSCFVPQRDRPSLLPSSNDPRRDRLGARASNAYDSLAQWVTREQRSELRSLPEFLEGAMRQFWLEQNLTLTQVTAYRALLDAAQRYEAVAQRLGQAQPSLAQSFYELLAAGTVTAKPNLADLDRRGLVLGTIYQYRMTRQSHRWQFWLDAGSSLWNSAYSSFGSFQIKNPYLFLQDWSGEVWSPDRTQVVLDEQLRRTLSDLLHRCGDRVILCHSDLSIAGGELTGPLLPIVDRATLWDLPSAIASRSPETEPSATVG
ncbi:hypothetical protein [Synechococcus sp. PCC 7336]|uniref:hypothetical protein n=1 Tax=Synechococcus sp. PCC 7336 TaxID=195250 RepID=UPI0003613369|nr:hypothetical protein [Synechococcus sp. PCC 7336]